MRACVAKTRALFESGRPVADAVHGRLRLGAARDLARRHRASSQDRALRLRHAAVPSQTHRRGRVGHTRAARSCGTIARSTAARAMCDVRRAHVQHVHVRRADVHVPRHQLLLLVPRPAGGEACRDHRRLGLLPRRGRRGGRGGRNVTRRPRWSVGGAKSRRVSTAARRRRRRDARWRRSSAGSTCRAMRSTRSSTAWRWTSDRRRYETFDDLYLYCIARRVRGRPDVPRDLRLFAIRRRGSTRPTSASRCSSPTSCATCRRICRAAASTSRRRTCGGSACSEEDLQRETANAGARRPVGGGEGAAAASGRPRARVLRPRGGVASCRRRTAPRRRRDHGGDLLRDPETDRGGRLRRLLRASSASPVLGAR